MESSNIVRVKHKTIETIKEDNFDPLSRKLSEVQKKRKNTF